MKKRNSNIPFANLQGSFLGQRPIFVGINRAMSKGPGSKPNLIRSMFGAKPSGPIQG